MPDRYAKLIVKAQKGDKRAFARIYKIFLPRIYRFVYIFVKSETLAEDITQNTFVRVWKSLNKFSTKKGSIQSYLYKIARNLVIDHQRKKKETLLDTEIENNLESGENIEEKYIRKEKAQTVRNALSSLSEQDRLLVILKYFEDLSYKEISGIVKKSEGFLRVRVFRSLIYIKRKLKHLR